MKAKTPTGAATGQNHLAGLYRESLALLTDLYQLTMAYGYWRTGVAEREAVFHLFFRKCPFAGGYAIAAGLEQVLEYLQGLRFGEDDLCYLQSLTGNDGQPLFTADFLAYLGKLDLGLDVDAMPEGTVVFAHEPLLRVRGPILQAQLIETALLNIINFQTLIATKAARVVMATGGETVLEFGLRRAQGIDGSLCASRAAYIGGVDATSNVLAGKLFGIPVRGTHAHSWVMFHDSEREAFLAYAEAMPNNCVFLVDTYDTLEGVAHAIEVGRWLRERGHKLGGVRLDSGDLAYLSQQTRAMLDEAGFADANIVASNDLDERLVTSLKQQGAKINVWGIGTKLITAYDQPALGGVYKLSGVRAQDGTWQHRIKISEQAIKTSNPGVQQVRRFSQDGAFIADAICDSEAMPKNGCVLVDQTDPTRQKRIGAEVAFEDLLVPVLRRGAPVYDPPTLAQIRARKTAQLSALHQGIKRFDNPHQYPAGLEASLMEQKLALVKSARGLT
jgi:nicotinate phosphoribosyltransferase